MPQHKRLRATRYRKWFLERAGRNPEGMRLTDHTAHKAALEGRSSNAHLHWTGMTRTAAELEGTVGQ